MTARFRPWHGLLGALLLMAFTAPVTAGGTTPAVDIEAPTQSDFVRLPGQIVIETNGSGIDPDDPAIIGLIDGLRRQTEQRSDAAPRRDLPPNTAAAGGALVADYSGSGTTVPADVKAVINAALADWDAALDTNRTVVLEVTWEPFGNAGILGFAGPTDHFSQTSSGFIFPVALANDLSNADLNGPSSEIQMGINSELGSSWYSSLDESPGPGQIDLYSVVLHEIGHGLGFLGSARDPDGGGFASPSLGNPPFIYDNFVYTSEGRLLDSNAQASELVSSDIYFELGGGQRHELYAPAGFQNGSSYSHFDFRYGVGDPGVMMTPALGPAEVQRTIDAPVLGVLHQQGWEMVPRAVTPTITGTETASGTISVTWANNLEQYGLPPLTHVVSVSRNGSIVATKTVSGKTTTTTFNGLPNGQVYTVSVTPADSRGPAVGDTVMVDLPDIPDKPRYVSSEGVGLSRVVSWQAPPPTNTGGAPTYLVQSRPIFGQTWTTVGTTSATSITTPTLNEDIYQFRVRADNANGSGDFALSTLIGVADGLVRPMALDGQVSRLYQAYFLRPPDQAGYDYWVQQRASGVSLNAISASFAGSPEFASLYGSLSDSDFIDRVYLNVQGRPADADGKAFWLSYLAAGNSRGSMMIGFSESTEFENLTGTAPASDVGEGRISRLYLAFFLREPDSSGLLFWVGRLGSGTSLNSIADGFVQSAEFDEEYGGLTNRAFVELVYANVLTRPPDAGGIDFWTTQLDSGATSRGAMMVGFSESLEFKVRSGTLPS